MKKYGISNLYVLRPSIVADKRLEYTVLMKKERETLIVIQKTAFLTIAEYDDKNTCFHSIETDEIIQKKEDSNLKYGNKYVGIFERDFDSLRNYLWNIEINDIKNKELCNHILKMYPEYTHEELIEILNLLKKESKFYIEKTKSYKRKLIRQTNK